MKKIIIVLIFALIPLSSLFSQQNFISEKKAYSVLTHSEFFKEYKKDYSVYLDESPSTNKPYYIYAIRFKNSEMGGTIAWIYIDAMNKKIYKMGDSPDDLVLIH